MRFAISKPKFGLCRIECICVCTDCPLSCLLYFVCRWPTHPPWTISMAQAALCDITPQTRIPTRPRLAYGRYISFSVCMCLCLLADVNLDQTGCGVSPHGDWSGSSATGRPTATWGCMRRGHPMTGGWHVGYGICCWSRCAWPGSSRGSAIICWGSPFDPLDTLRAMCRTRYIPVDGAGGV